MKILVAEDETIIRLDLRGLLERAGYEVVAEARDGEEAVELARQHEPDLAVLDVKMPRLDGIEAARRMLEERPIPIVMLTAFDQRELVERAAEAGVYGYLVKPFREQDVVPAIELARARYEELVAVRGGGAAASKAASGARPRTRDEKARGARAGAVTEDEVPSRLDIRGQRADGAIRNLEAFLDTLYASGSSMGVVVHGHGTGALKDAVRDVLKLSPYVEAFRAGDRHEGGDGATVVTLRS